MRLVVKPGQIRRLLQVVQMEVVLHKRRVPDPKRIWRMWRRIRLRHGQLLSSHVSSISTRHRHNMNFPEAAVQLAALLCFPEWVFEVEEEEGARMQGTFATVLDVV